MPHLVKIVNEVRKDTKKDATTAKPDEFKNKEMGTKCKRCKNPGLTPCRAQPPRVMCNFSCSSNSGIFLALELTEDLEI